MNIRFWRRRIYADWAATTPLHPAVARAMKRARKAWANPSAIHAEGAAAKRALEAARDSVARLLSVKPHDVFFTSGGTEANGTIIQGILRASLEKGVAPKDLHVVATAIEHSSILEPLKIFEKHGIRVTYVAPGKDGVVRAEDVLAAVGPQTVLVTCMYANNEIGTIQPASKIGAGIRKIRAEKLSSGAPAADAAHPIFHVDASQAPLWLSCDPEGLRADAVTLDAHKMQGPKGVGALVVRHRIAFEPLMVGGGQERGKRPTTESVELAAGFAKALELAIEGRAKRSERAAKAQDAFFKMIDAEIPHAVVNGSRERRLPNNVNLSLPHLSDPEFAVLKLDAAGIACSTKSSCLKGEEESYVVAALASASGGPKWQARNTIRFSFAPDVSRGEMRHIVGALKALG